MQKIKENYIKQMYKSDLSKGCLVLLLDLISVANEKGVAQIYYKDFVDISKYSVAQFYNILNELESSGFIHRKKTSDYFKEIVITLLGNDFTNNGYKDSYVDINKVFFSERKYSELKVGAIKCYLYLVFRINKQQYESQKNPNANKLIYKNYYKSIQQQLNISERSLNEHMRSLKSKGYICIAKEIIKGKKGKLDIISLTKKGLEIPFVTLTNKGVKTMSKVKPLFSHWKYFVLTLCRRYKKTISKSNLDDSAILILQYSKKAHEQGKDIFSLMETTFKNIETLEVESKIVHNILKNLVKKDYNETLVFS